MKPLFTISFLLFALNVHLLFAQDTITYSNGTKVYGTFLGMDGHNIRFRINGTNNSSALNTKIPNDQTNSISDCERLSTGDALFINESAYATDVHIYAIGSPDTNPRTNPEVAAISVPPNSSSPVYQLSPGVHYMKYWRPGIDTHWEQILITKCGNLKFNLK